MRVVIGFGNDLRGEDRFGVEVISLLQNEKLENTKLLSLFQLTPEVCLELLEAEEVIFVDAAFSKDYNYSLACNLSCEQNFNLTHHLSPKVIIELLNNLYGVFPKFEVYSMLTSKFDNIYDNKKYKDCLKKVVCSIK